MKINWKVLIICFLIVTAVASIGSIFTNTGGWYEQNKPSITPPSYVFPIVWTFLFILIALALYFVWIKSKKQNKTKIILIFGANFLFNIFWTLFYFKLQNPLIAFVDLTLIWVTIIAMISISLKIDKKAGYMLIPYLLWVSFAGILNYLSI